ncbi:MAG: PKD domain-containing protein [Candidatus Bacteroides intestinipullorum]|uniref:PKD domain-containing protein n=1 Tax=Candidatus Bacteroides intestinipullorum TaxID=2838471 RepID=A0A9E2KH26_9BACE|nr:PKD domain-containing protein [Candidatus Bacteroides intestinipullorum]
MKKVFYALLATVLVFVTSCKDDDTIYNTAARAGFTVGDTYDVGEPITFTDTTVPEEGTTIVSYLWEFGDEAGSTSTESNPTFTYTRDGEYTVRLTVTDSNDLKARSEKVIIIVNPTNPDFTTDKEEYEMGELIHFTDATTTKSGTTITAWHWTFGDEAESTSDEQNPTFVYDVAGSYAVTLTVTDSYDLQSSVTKNITVYDPAAAVSMEWSALLGGNVQAGSSAALSPDGSTVYMMRSLSGSDVAALVAYDAASGSQKWMVDLSVAMQGASPTAQARDIFSSPAVDDNGNVYMIVRDLQSEADRNLYTISVSADGSLRWAVPVATPGSNLYATTPAIAADGSIFIAHRDGKVGSLTPDGEYTEYPSTGLSNITSGVAISRSGMVYVTGGNSLGLFGYNPSTDVSWTYNTNFGGASSALIGALKSTTVAIGADGTVYSVSDATSGGIIFAVDGVTGAEKWAYTTVGAIPDGGVALGADGTVYASGGEYLASTPSAGIYAINPDGTLKWHYPSTAAVQTSPIVDSRGYIHFVDAEATYYVLTAEGELFSSLSLGDACASSPVMDANGNLYVAVNANGQFQVVCASSKGDSYATDSPWPMRGGNPQRTGLQK